MGGEMITLQGYKIPVIENMGATLDQFDTIDMSDNEIRKLDGFPLLKRLKCLLLNNNRVVRIGEHLEDNLPGLDTLILSNNTIQELGDLDNLATCPNLSVLSLLRNPVTTKRHYRLYVVHKIPQLRLLDFQKIKLKEREAATQMFKGKKGQKLAQDMSKRTRTFVPGAGLPAAAAAVSARKPVAEANGEEEKSDVAQGERHDVEAIKMAIANASTLEEVERLNMMLQSGQIPGQQRPPPQNGDLPMEEEET